MNLRTIDSLIAEKVMGWPVFDCMTAFREDERITGLLEWCYRLGDGVLVHHKREGGEHRAIEFVPTENPAAAKQVREKLREKFPKVLLEIGKRVECAVYDGLATSILRGNSIAESEADTEELATCLCALKAFNVEIPE